MQILLNTAKGTLQSSAEFLSEVFQQLTLFAALGIVVDITKKIVKEVSKTIKEYDNNSKIFHSISVSQLKLNAFVTVTTQ